MSRIAPHAPEPVAKAQRRFLSREASEGLCGVCGLAVGLSEAQWDHRLSLVAGGSNDLSNFQPTHPACHAIKSKSDVRIGAKIARILCPRERDETGVRGKRRPVPRPSTDKGD